MATCFSARSSRSAADSEDATDKSAVSPGPLAPARELLGEMLLEAGKPAEAQREFELSLEVVPNRLRSLAGAGQAAALAGKKAQARMHYRQLLVLTKDADSERAAMKAAREFLARR